MALQPRGEGDRPLTKHGMQWCCAGYVEKRFPYSRSGLGPYGSNTEISHLHC